MEKYSIILNEQMIKNNSENRFHIFIPVNVEKVIASVRRPEENNYFEELVLRLFSKKGRTIDEVAQILQLAPAFVKKIFDKLIAKELIDRYFIITEKGKRNISEIENKENREVMYIFYDLIGKCYWNIAVNEEEYDSFIRENSLLDTGKYPMLDSDKKWEYQKISVGPAGDSKDIVLRYLPIDSNEKLIDKKATSLEVTNIISQHQRILMDAKRENFTVSQKYFKMIPEISVENRSMGLVETVYIGTVIQITGEDDWEVLNPFGFGVSSDYRWKLENKFEENKNKDKDMWKNLKGNRDKDIWKNLKEWIDKQCKIYSRNRVDSITLDIEDRAIKEIYGLGLNEYCGVSAKVKKILSCYRNMLNFEENENQNISWQSYAQDYIEWMLRALEEALKISEEKEGIEDFQDKFIGDINLKMRIKAEKLRFVIPQNSYLFRMKKSSLKNGFGVFPMVGRNLLLETEGIVRVARNNSGFLNFLSCLKDIDEGVSYCIEDGDDDILNYITEFLETIGSLLGIGCNSSGIEKMFENLETSEEK